MVLGLVMHRYGLLPIFRYTYQQISDDTDNRSHIVNSCVCQIFWPQTVNFRSSSTGDVSSSLHLPFYTYCADNASTWLRNAHAPFITQVIGESTDADTPQEGHY